MHLATSGTSGIHHPSNKCCFFFPFQYIWSQQPPLDLTPGLATGQLWPLANRILSLAPTCTLCKWSHQSHLPGPL